MSKYSAKEEFLYYATIFVEEIQIHRADYEHAISNSNSNMQRLVSAKGAALTAFIIVTSHLLESDFFNKAHKASKNWKDNDFKEVAETVFGLLIEFIHGDEDTMHPIMTEEDIAYVSLANSEFIKEWINGITPSSPHIMHFIIDALSNKAADEATLLFE